MMSRIDIPTEYGTYAFLNAVDHFTLVLPYDSVLGRDVKLNSIVTVFCYDDQTYFEAVNTPGTKLAVDDAEDHMYCDVQYVRECRLKHVTNREWFASYGPQTKREWAEYLLQQSSVKATGDYPVKVVCVKKCDPELRDFNARYKYRYRKNK